MTDGREDGRDLAEEEVAEDEIVERPTVDEVAGKLQASAMALGAGRVPTMPPVEPTSFSIRKATNGAGFVLEWYPTHDPCFEIHTSIDACCEAIKDLL